MIKIQIYTALLFSLSLYSPSIALTNDNNLDEGNTKEEIQHPSKPIKQESLDLYSGQLFISRVATHLDRELVNVEHGFMRQSSYTGVQDDFVALVTTKGGRILEVGPAMGNTLELVIEKQKYTKIKMPINYVVSEKDKICRETFQKKFNYLTGEKTLNITPVITRSEGIKHVNIPTNKGKYDAIAAFNVTHFFKPNEQLEFFSGSNQSLKMGGEIISHSRFSLWSQNIRNIKRLYRK